MFFKKSKFNNSVYLQSEIELANYQYDSDMKEDRSKHKNNEANTDGFEIDIDESIKHLITSPEFCDSILLDVTLMNPNSTDVIEKSALTGRQVRDMIESIEKQHKEKRKLINKILGNDNHSIDTIVKVTTHNNMEKIKTPCSDFNHRTNLQKSTNNNHQKNKRHEEKKITSASAPVERSTNDPQYFNCLTGMSVEVDPLFLNLKASLKNVEARINAMQENIEQTDETKSCDDYSNSHHYKNVPPNLYKGGDYLRTQQIYRTNRIPKDIDLKVGCQNKIEEGRPCLCGHCGVVGLLSEGQKFPVVAHSPDPKEILKKSKMAPQSLRGGGGLDEKQAIYLNRLSERVKILEERLEMHEEKLVTKEYFKRIITKVISHFTAKINSVRYDDRTHYGETERSFNYHVQNPQIIIDNTQTDSSDISKLNIKYNKQFKNNNSGFSRDDLNNQDLKFWKWGTEILKPGVDLKNKILSLIDTTFKRTSKTATNNNKDNKINSFINSDEISVQNLNKNGGPTNNNNYHQQVDEETYNNTFSKFTDFEKKCVRDSLVNETKKVNIAYVNPKISTWYDESNPSIKDFPVAQHAQPQQPTNVTKDIEKSAFFKTLEKTKEADKTRLWQSIWNQAKLNNQTKEDKVTIQIPNQQKGKSVKEIEFTIGELENILIKK